MDIKVCVLGFFQKRDKERHRKTDTRRPKMNKEMREVTLISQVEGNSDGMAAH